MSSMLTTPQVIVHPPDMAAHTASPSNRLRLHDPATSAANAARHSIISSSAKGWSPLQINKRDSATSPLKPSPNMSSPERSPSGVTSSPRRTSNSFKHVARNSLVSNSPFKSPTTTQGQQAAGLVVDLPSKDNVIHERRYAAPRPLGQTPDKAAGVASTPKAAIGLGISARPKSSSRVPSGSGSAVSGTRKASGEKNKVPVPPASGEKRVPGDRKVSGSKENDSPDIKAGKRVPRTSTGLKGLAKNEYVSKSPFLSHSKRIPSGDHSSRNYDGSPGPSPKTFPVQRDDVFSSPSPRRTSGGQRRSSPSPNALRPGARQSDSPTPSPPRTFTNPTVLSLSSTIRPSPLGLPTLGPGLQVQDETTPTPTPQKSSMTPSRRLRGPRNLSGAESPSRKTVTFQSVPDVKEFDRMSVEGSADGSFDIEREDDQQWQDDEHRDDSLDEILSSSNGGSQELLDQLGVLRVVNPDDSPLLSDVGHQNNDDESTTADFVNTLIEEGLFSPPQMATPVFEDQPAFEIPPEDTARPVANFLSTPSMGDSVHATPLLAKMPGFDAPVFPDTDSDGVPYGRTHHAERVALAHSLPPLDKISPIEQPALPHEDDHAMLLNANAAQPALPGRPAVSEDGPRLHQSGAMHDPFITLQTATNVLSPPLARMEDGIPLGRTSHAERVHAARVLATQSIGLGMPRSPAVSKGLTNVQASDSSKESVRTLSGRDVSVDGREVMFDVSFEDVPLDEAPKWKRMSQPPQPRPLDVPSPVASPSVAPQQDDKVEKRSSKLNFSLPSIGLTSPFSFSAPTMDNPKVPSSGSSEDGPERPLTPPSMIAKDNSKDSPHRLPELEFGELTLSEKRPSPSYYDPFASSGDGEAKPVKSQPSMVPSSPKAEAAPKTATSSWEGSTTSKVRQRISREMIRETIQQRIADGSISKRSSFMGAPTTIATTSVVPPKSASPTTMASRSALHLQSGSVDKDLPPPPPAKDLRSHTMAQAATTNEANSTGQTSSDRPAMRPRSQTQSAHDVLKAGEKDGLIDEPRSALDQLVADILPKTPTEVVDQQPKLVGILQKPKQPQSLVLSPPAPRAPSGGAEGGMTLSTQTSRTELGEAARGNRTVSGVGSSSRKPRRSLSTGDVWDEAEPVKTFRHSANSRLTLGGMHDGVSMLDAFQEDIGHIGSDRGYKVKERPKVKASYGDKVGHSRAGGDIDNGKAWRALRRPSDMNEHAAEIRAMRAREAVNGKASGNIFVKVLGIEGLTVPIPEHQTMFCITLDNGIDYIRTPYTVLTEGARVNQEFSLVEHPNFEFSLSLDIRRDPHILKALHEKHNTPIATLAISSPSPAKTSGFRALFSSPRKARSGRPESRAGTPQPTPAPAPADNIARYLATPSSSTIAKTHVAFKPIAKNCEAKVLEIRYPMFAMFKGEPDRSSVNSEGTSSRKQVAKITLQIFRLPPLPGLKPEDLPGSIDECLRGIRHHAWHEHEYHEGVLTQQGGDCSLPKRRMFKLIGGSLVAINEVTKKQVASIDLRRMTAVVDLNPGSSAGAGGSPKSTRTAVTYRPRNSDEVWSARPRSFRVEFGEDDDEGIVFEADRAEDKAVWMETLIGLIDKIPSNPLWAELLAQRQRERAQKRSASSTSLAGGAGRRSSSGVRGREKRERESIAMGGTGAITR